MTANMLTPARPLRLAGSYRQVYDVLPVFDALTAREIQDTLSARGWKYSLDTIYRALDGLMAIGIINEGEPIEGFRKRTVKVWRKARAG